MLRIIYIGMLLLCLPFAGMAQQGAWYRTQLLGQLGEAAQLSLTPSAKDTTLMVGNYKGYPVVAEWQSGVVHHLGIRLFAPEIKAVTNKTLCDFAERYLLEELTCESPEDLERKRFDEGVRHTGNLQSIVNRNDLLFSINNPERGLYELVWDSTSGERLFTLTLPANWSLISGRHKIELEDGLKSEMNQFVPPSKEEAAPKASKMEKTTTKGIWVYKRGFYMIPQMASARYYREITDGEETQYELLIDKKFAAETLINLLSSATAGKSYAVEVTQQKYGFKQENYTVNLARMVGFFLSNGCRPYVGIEQSNEGRVVATLLMVNEDWGYNHILQVTLERNQIGLPNSRIKATLNAYTPTHNLETLYDDERQMKKKSTTKIKLNTQ